jgi:MFS family permease
MVVLLTSGVLALIAFVFVERRAKEPVLPLHLFSIRAFSTSSVVSFIVGFAMFGAITYLPVFFQIVHDESPTASGLQLLPLLGGLIIFSTLSGVLITRTGRYRIFPILGTGLIAVGLALLSLLEVDTSSVVGGLYMFVLGIGLGCVMQVLVLIVQNSVPHSELGVATSAATFFRSIGGSFGTAIFGAIFSNVLAGNLISQLGHVKLRAGLSTSGVTPAILNTLPPTVHHGIAVAYAESISTVFTIAVPIGLLAFACSWLIPQVELRQGIDTPPVEALVPAPAGSAMAGRDA